MGSSVLRPAATALATVAWMLVSGCATSGHRFPGSSSDAAIPGSRVSATDLALKGRTAPLARPHAEQKFFAELLSVYQFQSSKHLQSRVEAFLSAHPESPLVDNALYLLSLRQLEESRNGLAEQTLLRLIRERPTSNKVPAARLAIGLLQARRGRSSEARSDLSSVLRGYPGSVESFRAQVELQAQGAIE